ncbi:MAG: hypothetical protein K8W52_14155 [Deltaproteobacteria bacterium]|nr:hypothetical protein [Deltaproteobacteria bacterium]
MAPRDARRWLVAASLLVGACTGAAPPGAPDAAAAAGGLTFAWRAVPAIPGDLGGDVVVDAAGLVLRDLRVFGDAATGDARTNVAMVTLIWDGLGQPATVGFPVAPPGLYSALEMRADGGIDDSLTIHGHARQGDVVYPFELEVDGAVAIAVPLELELDVGRGAAVRVDVDLGAVVGTVDWAQVPVDAAGVLRHEEIDAGPASAALARAFSAHAADP